MNSLLIAAVLGCLLTTSIHAKEDELAKVEKTYQEAIGIARQPIKQFEAQYLDSLEKLKTETQKKGQLPRVLMINQEIENFARPEKRDYREFQELHRLRRIYDDKIRTLQRQVLRDEKKLTEDYIGALDSLESKLTREGKLELAIKAKNRKDETKKDLARIDVNAGQGLDSPIWSLYEEGDFNLVLDCNLEREKDLWILTSPHTFDSRLESTTTFKPPFKMVAKAGTDSIEIRLYYAKQWLAVFNFRSNPQELLIRRSPGNQSSAVRFPDKGFITPNELHDLEVHVLKNAIVVYANGEERAKWEGEFAALEGPVAVGPAAGSKVSVERFAVYEID